MDDETDTPLPLTSESVAHEEPVVVTSELVPAQFQNPVMLR